jgi:hypothetical protein
MTLYNVNIYISSTYILSIFMVSSESGNNIACILSCAQDRGGSGHPHRPHRRGEQGDPPAGRRQDQHARQPQHQGESQVH